MSDYIIRFLIGGIAVSAFAVVGDVLRPKSFAGLFGAAPSIALCTLALAFSARGANYAALESRSMMIGAAALFIYSIAVCQLLQRWRLSAPVATSIGLLGWLVLAVAGERFLLG